MTMRQFDTSRQGVEIALGELSKKVEMHRKGVLHSDNQERGESGQAHVY